jgi:hypothetical protein
MGDMETQILTEIFYCCIEKLSLTPKTINFIQEFKPFISLWKLFAERGTNENRPIMLKKEKLD